MVRRLLLGVFAFSALGLGTVLGAGAASADSATATSESTAPVLLAVGVDDCPTCQILVDPCEFRQMCDPLPLNLRPPGLGLHPTVIHANIFNYFPDGPLACMQRRLMGPPVCASSGMPNMGGRLGTGMPGMAPATGPGGTAPAMGPSGTAPAAPATGPGGGGTAPATPTPARPN